MNNSPTPQIAPDVDTQVLPDIDGLVQNLMDSCKSIIVYNDDVNTFDHVIQCLIHYCNHTVSQAQEHTLRIHHQGKSLVMHGNMEELQPAYMGLVMEGLSCDIVD